MMRMIHSTAVKSSPKPTMALALVTGRCALRDLRARTTVRQATMQREQPSHMANVRMADQNRTLTTLRSDRWGMDSRAESRFDVHAVTSRSSRNCRLMSKLKMDYRTTPYPPHR